MTKPYGTKWFGYVTSKTNIKECHGY